MTTHVRKIDGGPMMGLGIVGTKRERPLELAFRAREVPVVNKFEETKRGVSFAKRLVKFQSFDHRLLRFRWLRPVIVAITQTCVGQSVARIFFDGLLEVFDSLLHSIDR